MKINLFVCGYKIIIKSIKSNKKQKMTEDKTTMQDDTGFSEDADFYSILNLPPDASLK